MDQQIDLYIQKMVKDCLSSQLFIGLTDEQKKQKEDEIADYFYSVVMQTLLNNLTDEQLQELQTVDFTSPEGIEKVQQLSSQIPDFLIMVDEALVHEVETIKKTGQIPATQ